VRPEHVHSFCSFPLRYARAQVVTRCKSLSARALFRAFPQGQRRLWGGEFWEEAIMLAASPQGEKSCRDHQRTCKYPSSITAGSKAEGAARKCSTKSTRHHGAKLSSNATAGTKRTWVDVVLRMRLPLPNYPEQDREGPILCRERLGGLLKYYARQAA
jgi:Transposase IS200 like